MSYTDTQPAAPFPLCADCVDGIGGACAGPDAEWRPALPGESCGAADCGAECDACGESVPYADAVGPTDAHLCPDCYTPEWRAANPPHLDHGALVNGHPCLVQTEQEHPHPCDCVQPYTDAVTSGDYLTEEY